MKSRAEAASELGASNAVRVPELDAIKEVTELDTRREERVVELDGTMEAVELDGREVR